jgi:hypothetical protein
MPTPSRFLAVAVLLTACACGVAQAEPCKGPTRSAAVSVVRDVWALVSDVSVLAHSQSSTQAQRAQAQPIPAAPPGGPSIDLSDISNTTAVERELQRSLGNKGNDLRLTVPRGSAWRGDYRLPSGESHPGDLLVVSGNADIAGKLLGNLVTVNGNVMVREGGLVSGDILTLGGTVHGEGEIGGEVRSFRSTSVLTPASAATVAAPDASPLQLTFGRIAGVIGVFLTLSALGFGLVMFGRPNLEVVSDTVAHSFGRAFITGLLGQILLLPTFGMLVVGLILSVAGILLLPFAVVVYTLLVIVAAVGGYLAVAHAMGETYIRRRMALGAVIGSPNSYRYLLIGIAALASLWLAWAIFGWVPVAGDLIRGAAFLVTWLLGTAGFGAALLSRAGIRENFAGRLIPPEALTDEYLWATPQFGVTAARRPGTRTPTRGL